MPIQKSEANPDTGSSRRTALALLAVVLMVLLTPVLLLIPSAITAHAAVNLKVGTKQLLASRVQIGNYERGVHYGSRGVGWDMVTFRFGNWEYGIVLLDPKLWHGISRFPQPLY
jgi:hypothetical protein